MGSHAERMEQRTERQLARDEKRAEKGQTSTMSLLANLTGNRPWTRPTFEMPMLISARDLAPLGADRMGRQWFSHKKYGEVVELPVIDTTRQEIPNSLVVEVDRDHYRHFGTPLEPGTYERLMNTAPRAQRAPKPSRPVRGLVGVYLADERPERVYGSHAAVSIIPQSSAVLNGEEAIARLKHAGASNVRLSTDRQDLVVTFPGGVPAPGVVELVERAKPEILAYLREDKPACTAWNHKTPRPAVGRVLGGAWACAPCLNGETS